MRKICVTGIGTDIGKTIISAILTEALEADYWKPIQAGDLQNSDSLKVRELISNSKTRIHPEGYRLSEPISPHAAGEIDDIVIDLNSIEIPKTNNNLIIEGAGGLMVPLNDKELIIDLMEKLNAEIILVVKNYLGSINHTLMSVDILKNRRFNILGIIFNGSPNSASEKYILNYTQLKCLGRIAEHKTISKEVVFNYKKAFEKV